MSSDNIPLILTLTFGCAALWALGVTWAVWNLYRRSWGIPDDEVDILREFVAGLRKIMADERRKPVKKVRTK